MNEATVRTVSEYLDEIRPNHKDWKHWYYRGHSKLSYDLLPKAGRLQACASDADYDQRMFHAWKLHSVGFINNFESYDDWDLLAIAQHHGLSTRLLDWTFNALNAAYFALYGRASSIDPSTDCAVYAHFSTLQSLTTPHCLTNSAPAKKQALNPNPFEIEGIRRVSPRSVVPRIARQGGIFTIHGPPHLDLNSNLTQGEELRRYVIPGENKADFARELSHYGVNSLSLFPDLDGLSDHINWTFETLS